MRHKTAYKATAIGLILIVIATFAAPAVMAQDLGWTFDTSYGGYVLPGVQNGSQDVQVDQRNVTASNAVVLEGLRNGVPVKFQTSMPGFVTDFCIGEVWINGVLVYTETNCNGKVIPVEEGTIEIKQSVGPNGGFRWTTSDPGANALTCPPADGVEACWRISTDGKTIEWLGATDGSVDIHQAAAPLALDAIRNGASVTFNVSVPGQIFACHAKVEMGGRLVKEWHDCAQLDDPVEVDPGQITISNSTTEQGGWRWSPRDGYGWRAPITATPLPAMTSTPTVTATNPPSVPTSTPTAGLDLAATQRAMGATQTQMAAPPTETPAPVLTATPTPSGGGGGPSGPPTGINWPLILGILAVLALIAAVVYYIWRRRHPTTPPVTPTTPTTPVALQITTVSPLPAVATAGPWSFNLAASGGTPPYQNWRLGAGAPPWMGRDPNTGKLFGTAVDGDFDFEVLVSDSSTPPRSVSKMLHLHVGP